MKYRIKNLPGYEKVASRYVFDRVTCTMYARTGIMDIMAEEFKVGGCEYMLLSEDNTELIHVDVRSLLDFSYNINP